MSEDERNQLAKAARPVALAIAKHHTSNCPHFREVAEAAAERAVVWCLKRHKPDKDWLAFVREIATRRVLWRLADTKDRKPRVSTEPMPDPELWEPDAALTSSGEPRGPADDPEFRMDVEALPEELRRPVELVAFEGCSIRETAARLKIGQHTVERRLREAYETLSR